MIAEARREQIRSLLLETGAVTVGQLQARFGVSPMTARRDLDVLERQGSARRTHGGAVLPSLAAPEDSFIKRVGVAAEAKLRIADAAFALLQPHETLFLDSSSTAFFLARRIAEGGTAVRVLTNSGPVMQVLTACDDPQIELYVVGGAHRRLTGSFVGPSAVRMIREHFVDRAFLSVTGIARHRILTDADGLEAAVKRAMIEQAREPVLLLDASKLATHGKHTIAPLSQISLVLADQLHGEDARRLRVDGVTVRDLSA
ncbi:DeoR/GlpR family DNA-binding transcription regulator [Solirubrobacter soli]|uniref:DeoR/GlpR family DNA-binding transcription regulator n=1 Tax=Solirubrobacter soli TaxID=363832 RepID=UPI000563CAEC|nr:DeoR/GlpR family DNA-binding transcription regulator [Solirubrobacter soli]